MHGERTQQSPGTSTRYLTLGYILGLSLLGLITVGGFFALHYTLGLHQAGLETLTLADELRMTSTRIASRTQYLNDTRRRSDAAARSQREAVKRNIRDDLAALRTTIAALSSRHLVANTLSTSVHHYLFEPPYNLQRKVERLIEQTEATVAIDQSRTQETFDAWPPADQVLSPSDSVLVGFQDALTALRARLQQTLGNVSFAHKLLAAISVVALLLEAMLLFRPLIRRLNHEIAKTVESHARLDFLA
ncbi:MAG: hypothetical protein AAF493_28455, partial [Pseudomonadota bacterium]